MPIDMSPDEFKRLGYQVIDTLAQRLAELPDTPTRSTIPQELSDALLNEEIPQDGTDPESVIQRVADEVLPYPMGNVSPGFFAWVNSTPSPIGVLGELMSAAHNASTAGGHHSSTYIEHAVLNWLKQIMGYATVAGGILTSGGSTANLTALAVMRHVKATHNVREHGMRDQHMVVYTSEQGHLCIQKSIEVLGIGNQHLRKIPVDADFCMNMDALKAAIAQDRLDGLHPVCVVASAGTVNTGAIDPLTEIADLCEAENLWFHVDGAYGGVGILAEQVAHLYAGIERADSIAIDPHKWLYVPIECGCTLVKDANTMRDTFSLMPSYVRDDGGMPWFMELGLQQTRQFKALKLWMTFQHIGINGYRELIARDIDLSSLLQLKIKARENFELIAAGELSITCFRYAPSGVGNLDALNQEIITRLQEDGRVFTTGTVLNGQQVIRACIVNFRTQEADLDRLLDVIDEIGAEILVE